MQTLSFVPINGHVSDNTLFTTFMSPELLGFISSKKRRALETRIKKYEMIHVLIKVI